MHRVQSGTVQVCHLHLEDGALHGGEEGGEGEGGLGMEGRKERGRVSREIGEREGGEGREGRGRVVEREENRREMRGRDRGERWIGRGGREMEGCGGSTGCITQEKYVPHHTQSSVCKH